MKLKEKYIKQKQQSDNYQLKKHTDSTPLLARLENEYLFHNQHQLGRNTHDKENVHSMINSVPGEEEKPKLRKILPHKRGYQPRLVSSRYEGFGEVKRARAKLKMYESQEELKIDGRELTDRDSQYRAEALDERPLTFGLIKKVDPMKSSVEYRQDQKIKNQILDEMSRLKNSQETLLASKQFESQRQTCINHNNKKAKYKLVTDEQQQDDEMVYCSKCAINLLQQGFKVEELKKQGVNHMKKSKGLGQGNSRMQEMRKFEERICEIENRIHRSLHACEDQFEAYVDKSDNTVEETKLLYDMLIDALQQMKQHELNYLNNQHEKNITEMETHKNILLQELETVGLMKQEIRECRNKFIMMKEAEFEFFTSSFLKKAHQYGEEKPHHPHDPETTREKLTRIIGELGKSIHGQEGRPSEELLCEENNQPFRTLFPEEHPQEYSHINYTNIMQLNHTHDSPSFKKMKEL